MILEHVRNGLSRFPKKLPAYLFYDDIGSRLYEQITSLPEYYLTRTERSILEANADDIVRRARGGDQSPLTIVELGAGSARKTELVLRAAAARQGECLYVPVDISATALDEATRRLKERRPWRDGPPSCSHPRTGLRGDPGSDAAGPRHLHR